MISEAREMEGFMQDWTPNWQLLSPNYCAETVAEVASWVAMGESGSLIGLPGMGKATLLNFLCYNAQALHPYLGDVRNKVILVPVDLNNLPNSRLATLYRTMLRSFHEARQQFEKPLRKRIKKVYKQFVQTQDAFWAQSGIRRLLLLFQEQGLRIVLVFNHFDRFCQTATPQMGYSLHSLRDSFRGTLCYLVGLRQELRFLPTSEQLGPLYGLLDTNVSWIGRLNPADAQEMILRRTDMADTRMDDLEIEEMLRLTGGSPSLLRVACSWWLEQPSSVPFEAWGEQLWKKPNSQHRLEAIWSALTQDEQFVLRQIQKLQSVRGAKSKKTQTEKLHKAHEDTLERLKAKGICYQADDQWKITGTLFARFVANVAGQGRGRVWLDETTGSILQGSRRLSSLPPLESTVLKHLIQFPHKRHSHTDLIEVAWSEDEIYREGKPTEALYQVIRGIRKIIEPDPSQPVYVQTWRGRPEGGYQFYPEGRPNS